MMSGRLPQTNHGMPNGRKNGKTKKPEDVKEFADYTRKKILQAYEITRSWSLPWLLHFPSE
jgi:hypothetical protein